MSSYSLKPYYESAPTKKSNIVFCRGGGGGAGGLRFPNISCSYSPPKASVHNLNVRKRNSWPRKSPPPAPSTEPSKNNGPSLSTSSFITEHKMVPSLCTTLLPSFSLSGGGGCTQTGAHFHRPKAPCNDEMHFVKTFNTTPFSCLRYYLPR